MSRLLLHTAASPAVLLDAAVAMVAPRMDADGWCIVVPRTHLRHDVERALLAARGGQGWVGHRVVTIESLVAHYARGIPGARLVTPIQMRQIINGLVEEMVAAPDGQAFAEHFVQGRVAEATLQSLTTLFAELEPYHYSAETLLQKLGEGPVSEAVSDRARAIADLYARYQARVTMAGFHGPMAVAVAAAERAAAVPPLPGVRRVLFLGFDGCGVWDIGMRMADALRRHDAVAEVGVVLTYPDDPGPSAWLHANTALIQHFAGAPRRLLPVQPALAARSPDLAALAADPFAFAEAPVPATPAVQVVRVPDTQLEVDWIATDAKRRLLADPSLTACDIAVVARDMRHRADDLVRAFAPYGLSVVASHEARLADVPAVRALLALFRLPALGWRVADVIAVAESPYLGLGLDASLLLRLGTSGTTPVGVLQWLERLNQLVQHDPEEVETVAGQAVREIRPASLVTDTTRTVDAFRHFATQLHGLIGGDAAAQTPKAWVAALKAALVQWHVEQRLYDTAGRVDRAEEARLARVDLDGLNALIAAAEEWRRGRDLAKGRDPDGAEARSADCSEPIDAEVWYSELAAMAQTASIRTTTAPKAAIHLVDPYQAALRQWRIVYVAGLTDGVFPAAVEPSEHTLTEAERRVLAMPTAEHRAARERLLFHCTAAAARDALILVTPAADERGKALVASPLIGGVALRLGGIVVQQVSARTLYPMEMAQAYTADARELLAADRYAAASADGTLAQAALTDPILAGWLASPRARLVTHRWAIERMRAMVDRGDVTDRAALLADPYRRHVALFTPDEVPEWLQADTALFNPAELAQLGNCRMRFFFQRMLGLVRVAEGDQEHDEAAAFGSLQHRVLEVLYRELQDTGHLPPRSHADIAHALERLEAVAHSCVRTYTASAHEQLWDLDFAFVVDVLRQFVRRDLSAMLLIRVTPDASVLQTEIVALETPAGTELHPVVIDEAGVRFRLRARLDRVERITDPRLPRQAGWYIVKDYKSSRSGYVPSLAKMLAGEALEAPLLAVVAQQHLSRPDAPAKVFGVGELKTTRREDPPLLSYRDVRFHESGVLTLEKRRDVEDGNPLKAAVGAARAKAAELVQIARSGDFTPQRDRKCFGCPLKDVCRHATIADPARSRRRAPMPILLPAGAGAPERAGR